MAGFQHLCFTVLLVVSVLDQSYCKPQIGGGRTGGYSEIDKNGDDVAKAKTVAVAALNRKVGSPIFGNPPGACQEVEAPVVIKAESQVVAGTNFRLRIRSRCGETRTCAITIFRPLPFQCTEDDPNFDLDCMQDARVQFCT